MKTTLTLETTYAPIAAGIQRVPAVIKETLRTPSRQIEDVVQYFFSKHGKLLRPALVFLGGGIARSLVPVAEVVSERQETSEVHLAAATEIFHAATLIHDDIIDSAPIRRGLLSLHVKWGPQTAVLAGDFFHDKAIVTIFRYGNERIIPLFLKTAGEICEGEVQELSEKNNINLSEATHFEILEKKTASLLACSLQTGALIWGMDETRVDALGRYGHAFGMAFQIIDDYLDFTGRESEFGKTLGADLEEGVYTLPVIHCLASSDRDKVVRILHARNHAKRFPMLKELLQKSGALTYSLGKARAFIHQAKQALVSFPESEFKNSLFDLADYVIQRER